MKIRKEIVSQCCKANLFAEGTGILCEKCLKKFLLHDGYIDFFPGAAPYGIIQHLWENTQVVKIYEKVRDMMLFFLTGRVIDSDSEYFVLKNLLHLEGSEIVLDLSCGNGRHALKNAEKLNEGHLFALDISEPMLKNLSEKVRDSGKGDKITILRSSSESIPLRDNSIDMVYCIAAMHLYQNQQKAVEEVSRVLKKGGLFAGTIFMESPFLPVKFMEQATASLSGLVFNRKSHFAEMIAEAGFASPEFGFLKPVAIFVTKKI
jgi:ubiquinone/menaquinone biosynthesis C-methylase UbiE